MSRGQSEFPIEPNMKLRCLIVVSVSLILFWPASFAHAQTTTVRGQLLLNGWNQFGAPQQYPAPGIQVTLYSQVFGRSSPTVTGTDGMFYFYNITLADYYVEIWISNPPRAYAFRISAFPFQDLPRIPVN